MKDRPHRKKATRAHNVQYFVGHVNSTPCLLNPNTHTMAIRYLGPVFSIRPDNIIKRKRDRITRSSCESQETKTKMASIYCRPIRLGLYVFSTLNFFKNHTLKLIARSINYLRYAQRIFVNMYTRVMNIFFHMIISTALVMILI